MGVAGVGQVVDLVDVDPDVSRVEQSHTRGKLVLRVTDDTEAA